MKELKILFIVRYTTETVRKTYVAEDYKTAFDYFTMREAEGKSPILYREITEVARQVLLRA